MPHVRSLINVKQRLAALMEGNHVWMHVVLMYRFPLSSVSSTQSLCRNLWIWVMGAHLPQN